MSLFGNAEDWYTDSFNVYRVIQTVEKGVTINKRKLISENNLGRIYFRKSNPLKSKGEVDVYSQIEDMLSCDTEIDIKEGDELEVKRGYLIGKWNGIIDKYLTGRATDYNIPFGGISPNLDHKEVSVQWINRNEASYENND